MTPEHLKQRTIAAAETILGCGYNVINLNGLDSATNAPFTQYEGNRLHKSPVDQAAALAFALIKNHCFIDGNKRTAFMMTVEYLAYYKLRLKDSLEPDEVAAMYIKVAAGQASRDELRRFLSVNVELIPRR